MLKNKKIRNWLIALVAVILLIPITARAYSSTRASTPQLNPNDKVVSMNVAETVDTTGSLEAKPFADLTWNTSGVVDKVNVKAGDQVKAGQVLATLKASGLNSSVIMAQSDLLTAQKALDDVVNSTDSNLAQAVIDLKNAQQAYDKAAYYLDYLQNSSKVPQTEIRRTEVKQRRGGWELVIKSKEFKGPASTDWLTQAQNDAALKKAQLQDAIDTYNRYKSGPNGQDVAAAQAKVDAAQATIDSMSIIAPFDGDVLFVQSRPDDLVNQDTPALNMANLDHLYIETQVDESKIANIKVGDPITATLDAVPGLQLTGKVSAIDQLGQVASNSVQYTVRMDLDPVAGNVFMPLGATANATIQIKPATAQLTVPITVIQNDSQGEFVMVVQPGASPKRVDVVSSTIVGDRVVVTGNLKEGDVLTTATPQTTNFRGPRIFGGRGN
ncbi:MAG: efflux RND transporter periplasmic adaptor subunit [Bacteroidota bacterium]